MNDESNPPQERVYFAVTADVVVITPEIAANWLNLNIKNRSPRAEGSSAYSRDIQGGEWLLTGDTIKFDWFGNLIDGQHRLKAVVESGASITTVVVWGVDPAVQKRVDTGMHRSFRDQLKLSSFKHADTLSALTRRVHQWEPPQEERVSFGRSKITHAELEKTLEQHPELLHCAEFVDGLPHSLLVPSLSAFIYWILIQANAEQAPVFMTGLTTGAGLSEGDPILVLRERLRREKDNRIGSRQFESEAIWLSVSAWNVWMDGRAAQKIQLPKGGKSRETFPKIRTRKRVRGSSIG